MANDIGEGVAPETTPEDVEPVAPEDTEDVNALKEQVTDLSEKNKQLFARAKKAEGFELVDGKWVKPPKAEKPKEAPANVENKPSQEPSKPGELDYGQKAFLKTYGIQGPDELALVKTFQARTGDDLDTIVSDDIFLAKLNGLREARETSAAVPKGAKRSTQSTVDSAELAYRKYEETGELPTDFDTRNKVVDMITKKEKGKNFNF